MDSARSPRSYASTNISPSPTLSTVYSGHLYANPWPSGTTPRRDYAKKKPDEPTEPDDTGRATQGAREQPRTGTTTPRLRSQSTRRPTGPLKTYRYPKSPHQYTSEGGDELRRWTSLSTVKVEEDSDSEAPYTAIKEWGRLSMQRVLDATTRNKILLLISSVALLHSSLDIGVSEASSEPDGRAEPPVDWVDGVAFLIALSILKNSRRHAPGNDHSSQQGVRVVRGDVQKTVNVKKLLIGDIVLIEPGDAIPCDGILIAGQGVECDESGPTGALNAVTKMTYCNFAKLHPDCFMVAGSRVIEGTGRYVVVATPEFATTAVTPRNTTNTSLGGLARNGFSKLKPDNLAELIVNIGSVAAWTHFASSTIRCLLPVGTGGPARTTTQNSVVLVTFLTLAVSMVLVAVGPTEASSKKKKKFGYLPLNVTFNDYSNHTNIHDSYNARNRHVTNSNNDSSVYSAVGPPSTLPIVDQRDQQPFIRPTYASHYSTSPKLQHEHPPPISQYTVPHQANTPPPYHSSESQFPQLHPSSAHGATRHQATPIPASY